MLTIIGAIVIIGLYAGVFAFTKWVVRGEREWRERESRTVRDAMPWCED